MRQFRNGRQASKPFSLLHLESEARGTCRPGSFHLFVSATPSGYRLCAVPRACTGREGGRRCMSCQSSFCDAQFCARAISNMAEPTHQILVLAAGARPRLPECGNVAHPSASLPILSQVLSLNIHRNSSAGLTHRDGLKLVRVISFAHVCTGPYRNLRRTGRLRSREAKGRPEDCKAELKDA